jgi:hypothetical protein
VTSAPLELTRAEIVAFRRTVGHLDARMPAGSASLREAAWAGLQDSMPRAAVLSIHARMAGTRPDTWEDPSLAQIWGPRYSAFVVVEQDAAVFSLGRLPEAGAARRRAEETADRLDAFLAGRRIPYGEAGHAMGVAPNSLRYGTATGRIRIRWDGARQPTIWTVPPPAIDPGDARRELARRFLHVFGPSTEDDFRRWAGIRPSPAGSTFTTMAGELVPVATPRGAAWLLATDEQLARTPSRDPGGPRLLPSGDAFFLLQGRDRELLVPDPARRATLWTSRVWPGCLLLDGEPAGTWRRADAVVSIEPWRSLSPADRAAVEAEAASLPLPGVAGRIAVRWLEGAER